MEQKITNIQSPKVSGKNDKFYPKNNLETWCSTQPFQISQPTDPDSPVVYDSDDDPFAFDLPMNTPGSISTGPFLAKKSEENL